MGNGSSHAGFPLTNREASLDVLRHTLGPEYRKRLVDVFRNGATGASEAITGGAEDDDAMYGGVEGGAVIGSAELQDYGNTMYNKQKEKLIRNIAETVFRALKMSGAKNAQTAPINTVVQHLMKVVPNPRKGGKMSDSFNKSSKSQQEACNVLAEAINTHYEGNLIDMSDAPGAKCAKVAEVMHTLLMGMHDEFMSVAGDVLRTLRNMQLLNSYVDASYRKQQDLIAKSGDSGLKQQSAEVAEFYKRIKAELERQMAMVSNMLNVSVGPTGKALIELLEQNRDFSGMVRDLKDDLGSDKFGAKIAYLLSGVSNVAYATSMVQKALKELGMSVKEFRDAKNTHELRLKVYKHIQDLKPTTRELERLVAAANMIYKFDYAHSTIAAAMKGGSDEYGMQGAEDNAGDGGHPDNVAAEGAAEVAGGDEDREPVGSDDDEVAEVAGGDDDDEPAAAGYWERRGLERKIKAKEKYRGLVLKDFRKVLKAHYREIIVASKAISAAIGKEIPVNDDLDRFINVFKHLPSVNEENLHIALSGYAKDVNSRNKRDSFINAYNLVISAAEPLARSEHGSHFRNLISALSATVKEMDNFNDRMVQSLTEIHIERPDEASSAVRSAVRDFFGSAEDEEHGYSEDVQNAFVEFNTVKEEMTYRYAIGHVKTNLSTIAGETEFFSKDYEEVLGEEAGWLINTIRKEFDERIEKSDPAKVPAGAAAPVDDDGPYNRTAYYLSTLNAGAAAGVAPSTNAYKALCTLWARQRDAKVKMVEVAQAVDLYLKSFSNGIAKNPDSIKSIVKMLDSVEFVAKWFNDRSGDNLAALFEFFPSRLVGHTVGSSTTPAPVDGNTGAPFDANHNQGKLDLPNTGGHYYDWLSTQNHASRTALAGNPFLGHPMTANNAKDKMKTLLEHTDKTIKSMRALENILSSFAKVGTKFGDLNPQASTFMNPGQIFNSLCEYLSASAYSSEYGTFTHNLASGIYRGEYERKEINNGGAALIVPGANAALGASARYSISATLNAGAPGPLGLQTMTYSHLIAHYANRASGVYTNPGDGGRAVDNIGAVGAANNALGATAAANPDHIREVANAVPIFGNTRNGGYANNIHGYTTATDDGTRLAFGRWGILTGTSTVNDLTANSPAEVATRVSRIGMAGLPDTSATNDAKWQYHNYSNRNQRTTLSGWRDDFYDTDMLFVMTIKGIVAKVFTMVDAYRLFNRPSTSRESHNSLSPLRTIMGGDEDGVAGGAVRSSVKVMPEAVELYLRLPLLAEWYREMFGFKKNRADNGPGAATIDNNVWQLSILPSIDGVWSGFMKIMFDKNEYVSEGNYTENAIQEMILEMNKIYSAYKAKSKASVRAILNAYVIEMNRVFGFIKKSEIESYLDKRRDYLSDRNYTPDTDGDGEPGSFDILDSEDQFGRAPAPSDKYIDVQLKAKQRKQRITLHLQKSIDELRRKMEASFRSYIQGENYSFVETLRNYRKELEVASGEREQYEVVLKMIQGSNKMVNVSADKLIMVHEAVVAPLSVLYRLTNVLNKFNSFLHGTSLQNIAELDAHLVAAAVAAGAGAAVAAGGPAPADGQALAVEYSNWLQTKYPYIKAEQKADFCFNAIADMYSRGVAATSGYFNLAGAAAANHILSVANVNANLIVRDTIRSLLDLCCNPNKLVQCSIGTNGNLNVDFSKVEEVAVALLSSVKSNINKLRIEFSDSGKLFERYEHAKYPGSVHWVEEHLVEILLKNRDRTGLDNATTECLRTTLEYASGKKEFLDYVPGALVPVPVPANLACGNVIQELIYYNNDISNISLMNNAINPIISIAWNNLTTFPFNVLPVLKDRDVRTPIENEALGLLQNNQVDWSGGAAAANHNATANKLVQVPGILFTNADEIQRWYSYGYGRNHSNSLVLTFNQVYRLFLRDNLEDGALKIYTPLIESFMNGAASYEVVQNNGLADIAAVPAAADITAVAVNLNNGGVVIQLPGKGSVLAASTAHTLKALMHTIDLRFKKKKFLYESLTEVPEHMKDRMKTNLPYYSKLFNMLAVRADMMRRLLENTGIKQNINVQLAAAPVAIAASIEGRKLQAATVNQGGQTTDAMLAYHTAGLNRLVQLCYAAKKCCDSVYTELNDSAPYFMDSSKDFISDYKQRHGVYPIMPASNVLLPQAAYSFPRLPPYQHNTVRLLLPTNQLGSMAYKFNRASRLVLARSDVEPQMEHMPGAKVIWNNYHAVANRQSVISAEDYKNTIKLMVVASRFLNDGVYSTLLDIDNEVSTAAVRNQLYYTANPYCEMRSTAKTKREVNTVLAIANINGADLLAKLQLIDRAAALVPAPAGGAVVPAGAPPVGTMAPGSPAEKAYDLLEPTTYQIQVSGITHVFDLAENPNHESMKERLASVIKVPTETKTDKRETMRIYNILDMNIVPINVHAFMREVPFVNILNYSYTFDRMVHDFIMPDYLEGVKVAGNPLGQMLTPEVMFIGPTDPIDSPRKLLILMLTHPQAKLKHGVYYNQVMHLLEGNDGFAGLGRPRYLSDQLWQKVLLNTSVFEGNAPGAGPAAIAAGPSGYAAARQFVNRGVFNGDLRSDWHINQANPNNAFQKPFVSAGLKKYHKTNKNYVAVATGGVIPVEDVMYLQELGALRFDTKLVRNLAWMVNLQRLMRKLLVDHLNFLPAPVIRGMKLSDPKLTEYNANDQYEDGDFRIEQQYSSI